MIRAAFTLIALAVLLIGCVSRTPEVPPEAPGVIALPTVEELAAMSADEKQALARSLVAQVRAAGGGAGAGAVTALVGPTVRLRWQDNPSNADRDWPRIGLVLQARPQHLGWWTGLPFAPDPTTPAEDAQGIMAFLAPVGWQGCTEMEIALRDICLYWPPDVPFDEQELFCGNQDPLNFSNTLLVGECLVPPPERIPVPEPGFASSLAAGIALLMRLETRRARR